MDDWVRLPIIFVIMFAGYLWLKWSTARNYHKLLVSWAPVPDYLRRNNFPISAKSQLSGVRDRIARLAQQGSWFGIDDTASTLGWYLEAFEKNQELSESAQALEEFINRADALSREAKEKGALERYQRIKSWRENVMIWAKVVKRFVPKLSQEAALRQA